MDTLTISPSHILQIPFSWPSVSFQCKAPFHRTLLALKSKIPLSSTYQWWNISVKKARAIPFEVPNLAPVSVTEILECPRWHSPHKKILRVFWVLLAASQCHQQLSITSITLIVYISHYLLNNILLASQNGYGQGEGIATTGGYGI